MINMIFLFCYRLTDMKLRSVLTKHVLTLPTTKQTYWTVWDILLNDNAFQPVYQTFVFEK